MHTHTLTSPISPSFIALPSPSHLPLWFATRTDWQIEHYNTCTQNHWNNGKRLTLANEGGANAACSCVKSSCLMLRLRMFRNSEDDTVLFKVMQNKANENKRHRLWGGKVDGLYFLKKNPPILAPGAGADAHHWDRAVCICHLDHHGHSGLGSRYWPVLVLKLWAAGGVL